MDKLMTVDEAAAAQHRPRFVRRLIAGRRVEFIHVGRHVRIPETALARLSLLERVHEGPFCNCAAILRCQPSWP